jgi:hypothetical protein
MNPEERTAMLAGMKMGAPPEIFVKCGNGFR